MMTSPLQIKLSGQNLILGSQSPRRKQLLQELNIQFEVIVKDVDESYPENLRCNEVAEYLIPVIIVYGAAIASPGLDFGQ